MTRKWMVLPFAFSMLGADGGGCNPWGGWSNPPPTQASSPSKPYCYTDPPLGCAAVCQDADTLAFTAACNNIEAGPVTQKFVQDIGTAFNNALDMGTHLCTSSNVGAIFTPCMAGVTPVEWANQDHEVCTPAPQGCPL